MSDRYHIVQLANGTFSLRSEGYGETFHPVIGPAAEAQALYVDQLKLRERVRAASEEFVIWDIGFGAAANPLTFLDAVRDCAATVRIISFDYTTEPLELALQNQDRLSYLQGWEPSLRELLAQHRCATQLREGLSIYWDLRLADFPSSLREGISAPPPHAIFFDAFSPARNPVMWTLEVFSNLFRQLDPLRPCSMPTYSRSTLLRVTLLLAGFYVGKGHATGEKEETTLAANQPELISEPLGRDWLMRAKRSRSSEPLREAKYIQRPLSDETWERLRAHPQFQGNQPP